MCFKAATEFTQQATRLSVPTAINLLYGPGTGAFAFTATPTWVKDGLFLRGDVSIVHVTNFSSAAPLAFGTDGTKLNPAVLSKPVSCSRWSDAASGTAQLIPLSRELNLEFQAIGKVG